MSAENILECPFCKVRLQKPTGIRRVSSPVLSIVDVPCPCCGDYGVQANDPAGKLSQLTEKERAALAAFVCQRSLDEKKAVILWSEPASPINISGEVWISFQRVVDEFPLPPLSERFDQVLLNLSKAGRPRQALNLGHHHLGLLCSEDTNMEFLILEGLLQRGYLKGGLVLPSNFQLSVDGWIRVEDLNRGLLGKDNRQAFVAMWFDPSMDAAFSEGIAPAVTDAGFTPFRVDRAESNNQITDEIVAGIRRSKFMVADITGNRSAVYYEAGLMHGLGRPVIFTCKNDHFKDASFDTNHYPHIQWETTKELRDKLLNRILATIVD